MKKFIKRKERCSLCGKKHLRVFTRNWFKKLLKLHKEAA
jgi:ribosomal protein L37E